jgi:putative flippase GtrA
VIFVRYVAIQLIAYGIDMGVFLVVLYSGISGALMANVIGKIAAGIFAFLSHQRFTFRVADDGRDLKQAVRYSFLLGLNVPISSAILSVMLLLINLPAAAKFISDVICVWLSFWLSKKWVFPVTGRNKDSSDLNSGRL